MQSYEGISAYSRCSCQFIDFCLPDSSIRSRQLHFYYNYYRKILLNHKIKAQNRGLGLEIYFYMIISGVLLIIIRSVLTTKISNVVNRPLSIKTVPLSFLTMIGTLLIAEAL